MRIASWNINGLRAILRKGELQRFISAAQPDILLLDEVKAKPEQLNAKFDGYQLIINSAKRAGYSGTGALIRENLAPCLASGRIKYNLPSEISHAYELVDAYGDANSEGRVTALELDNFYLVGVYTPNSKGDLSRLKLRQQGWDPAFLAYMNKLRAKKPVIFGGDLNVAHQTIDLANPTQNEGKHGYTIEERAGFDNLLAAGFVDSYRQMCGNKPGMYTWWSNWAKSRERNIGWRIDYLMVDSRLAGQLKGAEIYSEQMGSDHCPISIDIEV